MIFSQIIHVLAWLYLPVVLVALVSNVMAFIVFSQRSIHNRSFSVYSRFLLVSDTLALLDPLNNLFMYEYGLAITDHSLLACKSLHYIADTVQGISGNSIAFPFHITPFSA